MRSVVVSVLSLLITVQAAGEEVFRIEFGRDYRNYSQQDLQRRVWELERAVSQLQNRIFDLELAKAKAPTTAESWICTISAMGKTFTGTGATKAVAMHKSTEDCKGSVDSFFCKEPKCQQ